jgi:hypothetical protein
MRQLLLAQTWHAAALHILSVMVVFGPPGAPVPPYFYPFSPAPASLFPANLTILQRDGVATG